MAFRVNSNFRGSKDSHQPHLKGVSRLVNPKDDDPEIVSAEEEEGESDYLGRLLHVADEALSHVRQGVSHRARRGRIH
jgi:hypothetical protein